jgi:hypothetical protein
LNGSETPKLLRNLGLVLVGASGLALVIVSLVVLLAPGKAEWLFSKTPAKAFAVIVAAAILFGVGMQALLWFYLPPPGRLFLSMARWGMGFGPLGIGGVMLSEIELQPNDDGDYSVVWSSCSTGVETAFLAAALLIFLGFVGVKYKALEGNPLPQAE